MKKIIGVFVLLIVLLILGFGFQAAATNQSYNLWVYQINIFNHSIRIVDFLVGSIIVTLSIMMFLSIFIFGNRKKLERRQKIRDKMLPLYQKKLMDYLINMSSKLDDFYTLKIYVDYFKENAKSRYKRQLLIDMFCDLNLSLTLLNNERLQRLYRELNLHKNTIRKIHSRHWHKKIKGFKELYAMNITSENKHLYRCINSKNDLVRIEAQIALVDLSKEDKNANPFEFLGKLKTQFSLWEQITLHQVMVERDVKPPDFGKWVLLENTSVCMFCLRMIREYKQVWNFKKLENLLYHSDEAVRKLTIQVIGDLKLVDSLKHVKTRYHAETPENQLEILRSIGKSGEPKFIRFLQIALDKEDSADLQIEAAKAIHNCGDAGEAALKKMLVSDYKDYNIIVKHVLDHRII